MPIPRRVLGRTNLNISSLGLGTAEIGFPYGIEAKYGGVKELISDKDADAFLRSAVELGVTYFDTARAYQLAEERIGKSGIAKDPDILVGTKCAQFLEKGEVLSSSEMEKRIREEIEKSRKNLDMDILTLLYLHGGSEKQIKDGVVLEIIQKLKDEGKIKHIGISLRGEEAANAAINSGFFDVIQVAHSILDQRMIGEVLPKAKEKNIGVVNRSVLLKGSLTPKGRQLPDELYLLKTNAEKARKVANELGVPLPSLAIRFAISNPVVATALIGTASVEHLETAAQAVNDGPLPDDVLEELLTLAINDPEQVDPAQWPPV